MILKETSGTLVGKIPVGTETFIHNAGFVWLILLIPLAFATWFGMNNIRDEHVSPDIGSPISAFAKILLMLGIGLCTAAFGLYLLLGVGLDKFIVLPIVIILTVTLLKLIPGEIGRNLKRQYKIFGNKHTWVMTVIYTMTFGSFIGYAVGFGLSIKVIFGYQHVMVDGVMTHNLTNPDGPSALMYAWMGPFIGALIRPVGGMIADKLGGARVTQWVSIVMIGSAIGVAYYMQLAYASATPQDYFVPFLILFLILFTATGIGNGSTFKTIATIFNKEQAGPVLGWTAAIAAYGAFLIPKILGEQIKATTPEYALYGFAIFYAVCLVLNWFYYMRKSAEFHNP